MKFSIKWHKECLENARRSAQSDREAAERLTAHAARSERECIAYDALIIEAEMRGLDGFDREKFGKKRPSAASSPVQEPK